MPGGGMPGRTPGGIMPIGGGIPGGGPNPGGGMPGGGIPGGIIGMPGRIGGMPMGGGPPGGGMPGMAAPGGRIIGAADSCGRGAIMPGAGAPTPRPGPARPMGACPGMPAGRPRPAALPIPGPAGATCCLRGRVSSAGGGPSMVSEMISSPRSRSMPSTRRSSRSSSLLPFFGGNLRNSSASPSTKFMCRSYAIKRPQICRPSFSVTRMR